MFKNIVECTFSQLLGNLLVTDCLKIRHLDLSFCQALLLVNSLAAVFIHALVYFWLCSVTEIINNIMAFAILYNSIKGNWTNGTDYSTNALRMQLWPPIKVPLAQTHRGKYSQAVELAELYSHRCTEITSRECQASGPPHSFWHHTRLRVHK